MSKRMTSKLFQDDTVEKVDEGKVYVDPPEVDFDLDLSAIRKKRVRINGDNSKILELNLNDMGMPHRLEGAYNQLNLLMDEAVEKIGEIPDNVKDMSNEELSNVYKQLHETLSVIDNQMRKWVDYIFATNVSEICCDDGSMWDMYDGALRYEHIIEGLLSLYENNLDSEFEKMKKRVNDKTAKYKASVSKYHK